jgi:hypothetical protein
VEPVQIVKWFPPQRCMTPFLARWVAVPWVILVALVVVSTYWAYDRVEPLRILRQDIIPQAVAGEVILLEARVARDSSASCTVEVSRTIITKDGYRFPGGEFMYSPDALRSIHKNSPNMLRVAVSVPLGVPKGLATLHTTLQYHCNPLDKLWPITTTTELQFEVV